MDDFLAAALGFPAVLFGFALLVVVGYWLLVLAGGLDPGDHGHAGDLDTGPDGAGHGGPAGLVAAAGLGGVPVSVVLSLLIAVAWFLSLAGTALLADADVPALLRAALSAGVLAGAWAAAWVLVRPLRHLFPDERPPSRLDFVGRVCVIRTGRVGTDFGQAEVTAEDGSTAIVQVRAEPVLPRDGGPEPLHPGEPGLTAGATALIFDYDADGEFFRVAPFDAAPGPEHPAA
ncbi:YqiJ family protein [Streptomyces sp. HU2014]|uniref:YqiJ family protein n=1 Tax=Streptomyces sp. HU2014 TaxID=2939414 RepID=UPI00200F5654|nr:YqiJ family protein [Streptomyces sp. HU2014]UQI46869.1 YqiJ family protein [Streptomyces sp. HU2014]